MIWISTYIRSSDNSAIVHQVTYHFSLYMYQYSAYYT